MQEAYDQGAAILHGFFRQELEQYLKPGLSALGRRIVECCLDAGSVEDYQGLVAAD